MSSAWAYELRLLNEPQVSPQFQARRPCVACGYKAKVPASYVASYSYITGRGGRIGRNERPLCPSHAARFAAAHGLTMPYVTVAS